MNDFHDRQTEQILSFLAQFERKDKGMKEKVQFNKAIIGRMQI